MVRATMSEPSPLDTFRTAFGLLSHLYLTPVLVALVRGRVPDHLADGPLPATELAKRGGLNPLSVTRGLRALAAFGAFQEVSPGMFADTAVSDLYRDRQGSLRNAVLSGVTNTSSSRRRHSATAWRPVSRLGHVFGESFWDWTRRHPSQNEMFNRALAALRSDEHQQIAGAYNWTGVSTVVDVGGGAGSLLAATLAKHPGIRASRRAARGPPRCGPASIGAQCAGSMRVRRRKLLQCDSAPPARCGRSARSCTTGLTKRPHYPRALPRRHARHGPPARHRNAHGAL